MSLLPVHKIEGSPGSGKTTALCQWACQMVKEQGVQPQQVLLLYHTPQQQARLRKRLQGLDPKNANVYVIQSFEAFYVDFVKAHTDGLHLGEIPLRPDFGLLSALETRLIIAGLLPPEPAPSFATACAWAGLIERLQREQVSPSELQASSVESLQNLGVFYQHFLDKTETRQLLSYADLLALANQVLSHNPLAKAWLAERWQVILIDEAQELSSAQHQFFSRAGLPLVLAGNDQFSICSWRGAEPALFRQSSEFYDVKTHRCLTDQYRNPALANWVQYWLSNGNSANASGTPPVQFAYAQDTLAECQMLADWLQTQKATHQADWNDFAILLRSTQYRPYLLQALVQAGIPVKGDTLAEATRLAQQAMGDALQVMDAWWRLQIPAQPGLPQASDVINRLGQLPMEREEMAMQQANRHLLRYLGVVLPEADKGHLAYLMSGSQLAEHPLNFTALAQDELMQPALMILWQAYHAYWKSQDALQLCKTLLMPFGSPQTEGFLAALQKLTTTYRQSLDTPLPLSVLLQVSVSLWPSSEPLEGVNLYSLHQVQGEEFKFVAVPFMVHGEFPQSRHQPELLTEEARTYLQEHCGVQGLTTNPEEAEEARLLAVGLSRAQQEVFLSSHRQEAGQAVMPSPFFKDLLNAKRRLQQQVPLLFVCENSDARCGLDVCDHQQQAGELDLSSRYRGRSAWANLSVQAVEPLFEPDQELHLSASTIKTYMSCPRQFYYQHLLKLSTGDSQAASLGILIHKLMEVFNRQFGTQPYTAARLRTLAETLFVYESDPEAFESAGFDAKDAQRLQRLSPLSLADLKERLLASVDDLETQGYFKRYAGLKAVEAEKKLEHITLPGLERCRFQGTMDAVMQLADGSWEIVDYKTFHSAYSTASLDTCQAHFEKTLEPLPDDEGFSHSERFKNQLHAQYPKDYQLPLYYWANVQNAAYAGKLKGVALQIVRPGQASGQGSIRLELSASQLQQAQEQFIQDLKRYIVEPIRNSRGFSVNAGRSTCGNCSYTEICEAGADDEDEPA